MKIFLLSCLFLFQVVGNLHSQTFPVHTTLQVRSPYTTYLPDYFDGTDSKFSLGLQLMDASGTEFIELPAEPDVSDNWRISVGNVVNRLKYNLF